jgi:hypothetical protein
VRALLRAAERLARSTADEDLDRTVAGVHEALAARGAGNDGEHVVAARERRHLVATLDHSA